MNDAPLIEVKGERHEPLFNRDLSRKLIAWVFGFIVAQTLALILAGFGFASYVRSELVSLQAKDSAHEAAVDEIRDRARRAEDRLDKLAAEHNQLIGRVEATLPRK